jgi:hypothetical protein
MANIWAGIGVRVRGPAGLMTSALPSFKEAS